MKSMITPILVGAVAIGGTAMTTQAINDTKPANVTFTQQATATPKAFASIGSGDPAGYTAVTYGGAIRCTGGTWEPISDSGHTPEGIGTITMTSTYVQVNHVHVDKVNIAMYGWDNDYPLNGFYVTGASGGLDYDRFYFMKNGSQANPSTACDLPYTNVWIMGKGYVATP